MYSASAPVFTRTLNNMLAWLSAAQAHAEARQFDSANYLGQRLAPDMLPMVKQVQIATDAVKACMARLSGTEMPKWPDDEATLEQLSVRVRKCLDYLKTFSAGQIDGSEGRQIVIPLRGGESMTLDGETYLKHFALANFFFHSSATYMLLRHNGVALGKADFLGGR